jgi:integrase
MGTDLKFCQHKNLMDCPILRAAMCVQMSFPATAGGVFGDKPSQILAEFLASKKSANRRQVYINSLKYYLQKFLDEYPNFLNCQPSDIEKVLAKSSGAYSRQTWLNRISTLYSYCVRRGYLNNNPCDRIDRVTIDRAAPVVLTVSQAKALLEGCPTICKPYLALGMFAGIRPEEILRTDWENINLETRTVMVDGKTRRRRFVPLEDSALKILAQHPEKRGAVAPSASTVRRWKRAAREMLGGKWTADILRHTAASMLLAKYEDAGKVALWLGNSPQILLTHYHRPITKAECSAFWEL